MLCLIVTEILNKKGGSDINYKRNIGQFLKGGFSVIIEKCNYILSAKELYIFPLVLIFKTLVYARMFLLHCLNLFISSLNYW